MAKLSTNQITASMLKKLEDTNTKIDECENKLCKLKPIDFYQNETLEIMKQSLKNQYKMATMLRYLVKYTHNKDDKQKKKEEAK